MAGRKAKARTGAPLMLTDGSANDDGPDDDPYAGLAEYTGPAVPPPARSTQRAIAYPAPPPRRIANAPSTALVERTKWQDGFGNLFYEDTNELAYAYNPADTSQTHPWGDDYQGSNFWKSQYEGGYRPPAYPRPAPRYAQQQQQRPPPQQSYGAPPPPRPRPPPRQQSYGAPPPPPPQQSYNPPPQPPPPQQAPPEPAFPYSAEQASNVSDLLNTTDYYTILGIDRSASASDVKKAYYRQALKFHPDKNSAPGASEAFQLVAQAFETLKDDEKRARYDRSTTNGIRGPHFGLKLATPLNARAIFDAVAREMNGFFANTTPIRLW